MMIWSFKRKRHPDGTLDKHKARLCCHECQQQWGVNYWDTYAPVVSWSSVRILMTIAKLHNLHTKSVEFLQAYPKAKIKSSIYLHPPAGVILNRSKGDMVLKLIRNVYGLKDAGKTWNDFLKKGLIHRGWIQSNIDGCLFTKNVMLLILYVNDACFISPYKHKVDAEIKSLQQDYDLTDNGDLKDYLGTRFERHKDGSVTLTQPRMMERVFNIVRIDPASTNVKLHDTPASSDCILDNDPDGNPKLQKWSYRSAVGCLSYIRAIIRPDITMATQQCARFCNDPKQEHEEAVKRICRYLLKTKEKGLVLRPDKSKGLECFVDADWAGSWRHRSSNDPLSSHSRTGYYITYAGCSLMWKSKL